MTDPENRNGPANRAEDRTFDRTMMWLGGIVAALIIAALIGWGVSSNNTTPTASNPGATTGSATSEPPAAMQPKRP